MGHACLAFILALAATQAGARPTSEQDVRALAHLDDVYQDAVEKGDTRVMARLLDDRFVLVEGDGKRWSKTDIIAFSRSPGTRYEHQVDSQRTVRVWGDTAVVTAQLWAKGVEDNAPVDYRQWFSDTWVRTRHGWRYVFGQSSLSLPADGAK